MSHHLKLQISMYLLHVKAKQQEVVFRIKIFWNKIFQSSIGLDNLQWRFTTPFWLQVNYLFSDFMCFAIAFVVIYNYRFRWRKECSSFSASDEVNFVSVALNGVNFCDPPSIYSHDYLLHSNNLQHHLRNQLFCRASVPSSHAAASIKESKRFINFMKFVRYSNLKLQFVAWFMCLIDFWMSI